MHSEEVQEMEERGRKHMEEVTEKVSRQKTSIQRPEGV